MDKGGEALRRLYAELPGIECKGLCARECTDTIPCSPLEMRMAAREWSKTDIPPPLRPDGKCPYLSADNRCTVHPSRPMICRLYGLVKDELECKFGCKPNRWLTPAEGRKYLQLSIEIGKD